MLQFHHDIIASGRVLKTMSKNYSFNLTIHFKLIERIHENIIEGKETDELQKRILVFKEIIIKKILFK